MVGLDDSWEIGLYSQCMCVCAFVCMSPMWFRPPDIPPLLLFTLAFKCCQPTCCALNACALCVYLCVCVRVGCQWQPHLVLQIQTPPALPFSPNYFHPSSEAVGFRDVGLVSSLLAASSSPPCHPDLNHPDGCLPTNEPGGWMVGESKN